MPGDLQVWWELLHESLMLRLTLLIIAMAIITYPQWMGSLREKVGAKDKQSTWYAIQEWWLWRKIEKEETKKFRRQR